MSEYKTTEPGKKDKCCIKNKIKAKVAGMLIFKLGMAIRIRNPTTFRDQERIRIRNLNCSI